ncbi:MAG: hypothetical protein GX896_00245 [Clostridiales bacterium]|nr:hypothetical protein [Clostridiales bacterium]
MTALITAILLAIVSGALSGYFFIPYFRNKKTGVNSRFIPKRNDAPEHAKTTGGAFVILTGLVFGTTSGLVLLNLTEKTTDFKLKMLVPFGFFILAIVAIGYADDWLTDLKGQNVGLKSHHRLICLVLVSAIFLLLYRNMGGDSYVKTPFVNGQIGLGYFYMPVMILLVTAVCESMRLMTLTEGTAGCSGLVMLLCVGISALLLKNMEVAIILMSSVGALCAFLGWNLPPSQIKIGNAGKYLLAGLVVSCCFINSSEGAIPLVFAMPLVFLIALPVDRLFYKITGNRIFGKLPVDQQLKAMKWKDYKIIIFYTAFSVVTCGLYVFSVYREIKLLN